MAGAFSPATTMTRSVMGCSRSMVAPRKVLAAGVPSATGGHGRSALSRPMRVEKPAARTTPQILGDIAMPRRYQSAVAETSQYRAMPLYFCNGAIAFASNLHGHPDPIFERTGPARPGLRLGRSEEHTSELQSLRHLVCRL